MTTRSTSPVFVADGVTAVIVVAFTTLTLVSAFAFGEPPKTLFDGSSTKETDAPDVKPLPVMVTAWPPASGPDAGEIATPLGPGGTTPPETEVGRSHRRCRRGSRWRSRSR